MSLIKGNHGGLGGAGAPGGALGSFFSHTLDQSLRFDSGKLTKNITSAGDGKTFTVSMWVKRATTGADHELIAAGQGSDGVFAWRFRSDDTMQFATRYVNTNGANFQIARRGTRVFRDVGAWYHCVLAVDTTVSSASSKLDYFKIYVNGEDITYDFTTVTNTEESVAATYNDTTRWNQANNKDQSVGYNQAFTTNYFAGYLAEIHSISGTKLTADSFGETKDGVWIPKEYTGSYGTGGFYFDFADSSDIGNDASSGGSNDYTPSGLAASDVVLDSPTNNFATLNPLFNSVSQAVLLEGNLKAETAGFTSSAFGYGATSTFAIPKDKKIYIEVECTDVAGDSWFAGFATQTSIETGVGGNTGSDGSINVYNRSVKINGSENDYGSSAGLGGLGVAKLAAGDILGCMCDGATGKVWFSRNGTYFKTPTTNDSGTTGDPDNDSHEIGTLTNGTTEDIFLVLGGGTNANNIFVNFGQDSQNIASANADGNGIGTFEYAPPTDYLALCSSNLTDPTIGPGQSSQADDHFNTVLYTGDADNDVTATNTFAADWVWLKNRTDNSTNHYLQDIVRGFGASKSLSSNTTGSEGYNGGAPSSHNIVTSSSSLRLVSSDFATNAKNFVAWTWKAGGSASSNSNGSITSSVSANQDVGFAVGTYTGNATAGATIGHSLDAIPEMVIVKRRTNARDWAVYHKDQSSTPTNAYLLLNSNAAIGVGNTAWNNGTFTSDVFTIGSHELVNANTDSYVFYAFASVEGYSKVGSYVGNNNTDGPFSFTGFRPAWLMLKRSDSTADWLIYDNKRDTFNQMQFPLFPRSSDDEYTSNLLHVDFLSNGFKIRNATYGETNASGGNYIYLAFADQPFKFSNAR